MAWTGLFKNHPKFAMLGVTAAVAAALLLVPISYTKVVGHEVAVSMDGSKVSEDLVRGLASELKEALNAEAVMVDVGIDDGQRVYTLSASTSGNDAPAVSQAFARTLTDRGIETEASSTPIKKQVSSNVYAMAYENTFRLDSIEIDIDGKSAEEIEAEIVNQLEAAGFDAQVSVGMDDDHMKIEIQAESEGPAGEAEDHANIVLTKGGEPLVGGVTEKEGVHIMKSVDDGGEQMTVEVMNNGRKLTAVVKDPASLSDTELADIVHQQLREQGLNASVSVQDGRIRLLQLDGPEDQRQIKDTTWGRLKKEGVEGN